MKPKTLPPIPYLIACFRYDPDTGLLYWRTRPRSHFKDDHTWRIVNTRCAGMIAGTKVKHRRCRYYRISFNGKKYFAHRIVYTMHNGPFTGDLDHIDGNGLNNRIDNLREVSGHENAKNARRRIDNTSGVTGVYWHKTGSKWRVHISSGESKLVHLGIFTEWWDAVCARKSAEAKYGYHINHGR